MNDEKISSEYFKYYKKYVDEYGEKVCVLMQIGSFYEMLMLETPEKKIGNVIDIANILNIQVTKRNKNLDHVSNNPFMAGFPKVSVNKYLPLLLENNYTVILIDQNEEKKNGKVTRFVSSIYSSSIQPIDLDNFKDEGNDLTSIIIEVIENKNHNKKLKNSFLCSLLNLNLTTNSFEIYEYSENCLNLLLDKTYKIFSRYKNTEVLINVIYNKENYEDIINKNYFLDYLNLSINDCIHWKTIDINNSDYKSYINPEYQNSYLKKIYSHINFGLLTPIEFFDLSMYQLSIFNILKTIDFITKHDEKYIKNLEIPKIVCEYDYLTLEMNTLNQLDIIKGNSGKSLFDIINKTNTSIGKRGLKQLLLKPFKNPEIIEKRYKLSDSFEYILNNLPKNKLDNYLIEICDFEKLHRKMGLQALHPYQFFSLHNSYNKIIELVDIISNTNIPIDINELQKNCLSENTLLNLTNFISEYTETFDIYELKKYSLTDISNDITNIFKRGYIKEIDDIQFEIENINKNIENFRSKLEEIIIKSGKLQNSNDLIKLIYSDTEGYTLTCTKLRFNLLKKGMDTNEFDKLQVKTNTNMCKITSDKFKDLSIQLVLKKEILCKLTKIQYYEKLNYFYDKYSKLNLFNELKNFIELIDILNSNVKCKKQFNYCRPQIVNLNDNSFFNAKDLRHPIIEQLCNNLEYIPNDVCLNDNNNGMILYALNSSGKSSLLRSIGIAVILAQCGLYVPCSSFEYYPFTSIITQVDMYDNLWKGQSSFVSEMIGLKKILKLADKNSLVLSDELTKGTEVISATSIFTAAILELLNKNSKFVFTTHLHQVSTLEIIKNQKKLQICHLSVEINDNEIIFHRKLKPGPCSELYGLEVAKAVGLDSNFIDIAFDIRNGLMKTKKEILSTKKSKYNCRKLVDKCEICGYYPTNKTDIPLDIHHIDFQCTADENHFTRHFHKNSLHNLVCICKQCHQDVHLGKFIINGYIQTTNGIKLDWEPVKINNNKK